MAVRIDRRHVGGVLGAIAVLPLGACAGSGSTDEAAGVLPVVSATPGDVPALDGLTFEVHRDPGCGCCLSWVEYLRKHGATVEVTDDADRDVFRRDRGVGDEAASCHTAVVDGYAIEGHVPVGAIQRLVTARPAAAGLALPGMPGDAPGMGGDPSSWESQPVVLVESDGGLTNFDY